MSDAKPIHDSAVEIVQIVQPNDTNSLGTVFGGKVMALMDEVAALAAMRHARKAVVTAGMDALDFLAPVKMGHFLILKAQVNYAARTSMEVGVKCFAEDPLTGETRHTASAYLTFVALDGFGRPSNVPSVIAESEVDRRRYREAEQRRELRLRRRAQRDGAG